MSILTAIIGRTPFLTAWWVKPLLYVLLAFGLMWCGWHAHSIVDDANRAKELDVALANQRSAYEAQHTQDVSQHATDEAMLTASAQARDKLTGERDALLNAVQGKPLIKYVTKVVHDETGTHSCPVPTRDVSYRLCINAALSGSAEGRAACATSGSPAAVPGESVPATWNLR